MNLNILFSFATVMVFSVLTYTVGDIVNYHEKDKAMLIGKVLDNSTEAVLSSVTLTLFNGDRKTKTLTDQDGNFKIGGLEPGTYTLLAEDGEYQLYRQKLVLNKKEEVIIRMTPLPKGGL